ncbi:carboxypeptidase s [Daldinia sp. FL1419]|nr:carboxypeptidase s [Daldinia sp. FL1419]
MHEKGEVLPQSVTVASRTRSRSIWVTLIQIVAALILLKNTYDAFFSHPRDAALSSATSCPQVNPLFPRHNSSALSRLDDYITSPVFLNHTVARLAGAVQIPTQSYDDLGPIGQDKRWDVLFEFADFLEKTFPLVHETLELEKVNTHGLLYTWQGSDETLKPTVLMAHQDVVPVAESTVEQWTHPPFSGYFDGHFVWGRGSSDCKNNLIGIMEAVELLIGAGFEPKRTLILSFGFDEEIQGKQGAAQLARTLVSRYGKYGAAVIVDEGAGASTVWGSSFALPGVAEKGAIDVEIIVRMPGGHSSIPPAHNGIGVIAELVTAIEANPYEPRLYPENPYLSLLHCGAAHAEGFPSKLKKLLPSHNRQTCSKKDRLALEAAKAGDSVKYLFTTSAAPDIINGGVKNNALPERTSVLVNHRVNVGDHPSNVQEKLVRLAEEVANKHNLTVHAFNDEPETPRSITLKSGDDALEPAPVTPTSLDSVTPYSVLSGTTRAIYREKLLVAPGIMTGNTDTRYYWDLTRHIFRYGPGWDPEQEGFDGIHTVDEKLSIFAHIKGVQWYSLFIRNMDEAELV